MTGDTERYDLLFQLYEGYDTETLAAHREFIDLLPPLDSPIALEQWREARDGYDERADTIESAFPEHGETLSTLASIATRDQAFTALDLSSKYGRSVNVLVLDVDETLRSAGNTDNEIPRETLALLTLFHETGIPIVICTGQTLENVKGFLIQGLGNEIVHSGDVSIVYEAGTGVFTPEHGPQTKQLLYEGLDPGIQNVFTALRSRVLPDAPDRVRRYCHLQGNEFNVTLKPNFEHGSDRAKTVIDEALIYLLDLLDDAVGTEFGIDYPERSARLYYAEQDPEIASVLEAADELPDGDTDDLPSQLCTIYDRIDVAYYEADAAEIGSLELNKVVGVEAAFDVLGIEDPFALVMGDSKSDLRVMEWVEAEGIGIGAAPTHASQQVLDHVRSTDDLVFDRGDAAEMLRIAYALELLDTLE